MVTAIKEDRKINDLPTEHAAREYKHVYDELSIIDNEENPLLLYDNQRVVIPKEMRKYVLQYLHISHVGIVKSIETANNRYYWPGMTRDIKIMCENCTACRESKKL